MKKEKVYLLISVICLLLSIALNLLFFSKVDTESLLGDVAVNIDTSKIDLISYILSGVGVVYFLFLIINKNVDLSKHSRSILIWSIVFFLSSILSGVFGFIAYSKIDKKPKEKRRSLPIIEYKEFTNKYICLLGFILCMILMFVVPNYVSGLLASIIIYLLVLLIMILCFRKQLVHDFKIFKEYFGEYMSLTLKTWLKSLVVMMILGIALSIITNSPNSNNQQTLQNMFKIYPLFVIVLSMFYAPFAEELLFRGVIRKFIKSKYVFIIVSGVLFGLLHVIDDSKTLAEFSYILVYSSLGIFLASLYYKTNNLFTNISFHFFQNTLGILGMILTYFMK